SSAPGAVRRKRARTAAECWVRPDAVSHLGSQLRGYWRPTAALPSGPPLRSDATYAVARRSITSTVFQWRRAESDQRSASYSSASTKSSRASATVTAVERGG